MNSQKTREIIKFSIYKNIQNKWFLAFNIISLISAVLILNWNSITTLFKSEETEKPFEFAILDSGDLIYDGLSELESGENIKISRITENTYNAENMPDDFAVIEVLPDEEECFKINLISKEGIKLSIYSPVKDKMYEIRNTLFSKRYNVSSGDILTFQKDLSVNRVMLSVDAKDSESKEYIKLFSAAATYLLAVFVFSKLASEISQEKQSKSTEYILTTVSEKEYLFAKIFSNVIILVLQGLLMIVYYYIAALISQIINIAQTDIKLSASLMFNNMSKDIVIYILMLIIYNVLNLILLCIFQALVAAKTSSSSEAGNTVSLIVFGMMIAYTATVYFITPYNKVSLLLYLISCLPVLSAYFVPAMMVIGQAKMWQILVSLFILVVSIPVFFNLTAKPFKNGILNYTKLKKKETKEAETQEEYIEKKNVKSIGFVVGMGLVIYIGLQVIFSLICGMILPVLFENVLTTTELTLILQIILQVVSLGTAAKFVLSYVEKNPTKKEFKLGKKVKIVFLALVLIFGLQFLLGLLYPKIGLDYSSVDMFDISSDSSIMTKIIVIISIAIIPGIFEELFFRKALIDLTSKYSKKFALIFSALLFGFVHMNLSQGLFAFIIGIVFGSIYLYTNDIKLTMFIHFINNGFAALEMILPERFAIGLVFLLIASLVYGIDLFIRALINKESRKKIQDLLAIKVDFKLAKKYLYVFHDYIFDVALLLVMLMSVMTENLLR